MLEAFICFVLFEPICVNDTFYKDWYTMDQLPKKPLMPALAGLRGVGALWVVASHMQITLTSTNPGIRHLMWHGWLAVDFFFMLSGFVISYVYLERFATPQSLKNMGSFLWARFIRIYPATVVVLCCLWLPCFLTLKYLHFDIDPEIITKQGFILQVLLLNGLGFIDGGGWNGPSWALSSEFVLYCGFPFIALYIVRLKSKVVLWVHLALVLATVIGIALVLYHGNKFMLARQYTLIRAFSEFIMGCLLYKIFSQKSTASKTWLENPFMRNWAGLVSLGVIVIMSVVVVHPFWRFLYLIFFGIIILSAAQPGVLFTKLFSNPIMQKIGTLSFTLYLIHYFILSINRSILKKFLVRDGVAVDIGFALISLVMIFAGSWLLYTYVEKPAKKWLTAKRPSLQ